MEVSRLPTEISLAQLKPFKPLFSWVVGGVQQLNLRRILWLFRPPLKSTEGGGASECIYSDDGMLAEQWSGASLN